MGYSFGTMQIQCQLVYPVDWWILWNFNRNEFSIKQKKIKTKKVGKSVRSECEWNARCEIKHKCAALERHRVERIASGKYATDVIINNNFAFAGWWCARPVWFVVGGRHRLGNLMIKCMSYVCARARYAVAVCRQKWCPFDSCLCERIICLQFVAIHF